eukprot:UN09207
MSDLGSTVWKSLWSTCCITCVFICKSCASISSGDSSCCSKSSPSFTLCTNSR